jgi:hypothetical protein
MRLSTLLLSSAALVASGTVGFAADLPSKKAAPVEYVRICSQFGAGFFYIPGSDTCLKVSGRVRADYIYGEPFTRGQNALTFRGRGYLALDSYTATDWGPVRATTRVFVTKDTNSGYTTTLDWAYIQFAGITAGKAAVSFFDFAPFGGVSYLGGGANGRGSDEGDVNVLAYTATFGGGFSATIALEDGRDATTRNVPGTAIVRIDPTLQVLNTNGTQGGMWMPDVVGRLDYAGSWGAAMLAGAIHQTRVGNGTNINNLTPAGTILDTEYGFAVQAGVKINLPMLAKGDALFLQAAYADGANSYTGWGTAGAGTLSLPSADVIYDAFGSAKTTKSWSITGGLLHFWTPTIRQGVYGAYGAVNHYGPWYDAAAVSVGTNVIWTPVRGLDIGAEVGYQYLVDKPNFLLLPGNVATLVGSDSGQWFGRLRFQRDF